MTQAEFDELLVWLADDWADRRVAGLGFPVRWDELSLDLQRAIGGAVRFGQARGLQTVTVDVGERIKAARRRAQEDETLYARADEPSKAERFARYRH
jgi:hypothetical protein